VLNGHFLLGFQIFVEPLRNKEALVRLQRPPALSFVRLSLKLMGHHPLANLPRFFKHGGGHLGFLQVMLLIQITFKLG
jgi:hypothetical protein